MNHNVISIGGKVIADPREVPGKMFVFRVRSVSHRNKDNPLFIDVKAFGSLSSICIEHVKKGTKINVTGRLELREREVDGMKKYDYSVVADSVDYDNF
jgi:single-stranded DNA-binding protein